MKISQILESADLLKTHLALQSKPIPSTFKSRLDKIKNDYLNKKITKLDYHRALDEVEDDLNNIVFGDEYDNLVDELGYDDLINEYDEIENYLTNKLRKIQ
jgi:hypothetical protein